MDVNVDEESYAISNESSHYLSGHRKRTTHTRVHRSENHNFLPNVIGPWLPRRDVEGAAKSYYYASMLALLKPWRIFQDLKGDNEDWQTAFERFICDANQWDKDVVAGCQYYYESLSEGRKNEMENGEMEMDMTRDDEMIDNDNDPNESVSVLVRVILRINEIT